MRDRETMRVLSTGCVVGVVGVLRTTQMRLHMFREYDISCFVLVFLSSIEGGDFLIGTIDLMSKCVIF